MLTMKQKSEVLFRAAELIRFGYCKGPYALGRDGVACSADDPNAVEWCAVGALGRAGRDTDQPMFAGSGDYYLLQREVLALLGQEVGRYGSLPHWSDEHERHGGPSADDVATLYEAAALEALADTLGRGEAEAAGT